ncbi:hemagglutinin repeat-containing protein [uncultured Enterobacter sp.]|uniref:two-partner secretion domain-containing protein n=2 Tax=Enterobacteriaceae TaxID=543 RepID=UPI002617AC5C|nr:hemagglutinin repeat-containing protein [uncultured Enterobacter sp.]
MKNNSASKGKITAGTLHKHLCPLYLSLAGILSGTAEAAITPDASQKNGPSMGQTANGTPMVNIANPNAKGASLNKFTQFDVDKQGMVFNNSKNDGVTKIGGYAIKNAQLQQEASAIISEVTGARASYINGTMEVFGKKADVIIANQNGISVNGATTINANSLTLSTGKVQENNDGSYRLAVEKGNVTVTGQGISTEGLSYFDIVSRSAVLEGEIAGAADLKVVAGKNDYTLSDRSHTVRSKGDGTTPAVAIDGSALGSMYGGKIQLISTESGAGVRHAGSIIASSDIDISAEGDVSLTALKSGNDLNLSGKSVTLAKAAASGTEAKNNIVIRALSGVNISNDVISRNGTIRIDASSLLQNAAALIAENSKTTSIPAIQINVEGRYTLSGKLKALDASGNAIKNGVVTLKKGDFVVLVDGKEVAFSTIISDTELVSHGGDIQIAAGSVNNSEGVILAKKGTLQVNLKDGFENTGSVSATGNIVIASGSLKNNGILYATEQQTLTVDSLDNSGRIFADKQLVMRASALNNKGNIGVSNGSLQIATSGDVTNSGTISSEDGLIELDADGAINNSGTLVSNQNDVAVTSRGALVKNDGQIQARNVDVTVAKGKLDNRGAVKAKQNVKVKSSELNNAGMLSAPGDMTLDVSKTLVNTQGGNILSDGSLTVKGSGKLDVVNEGAGWIQGKSLVAEGLASLANTGDAVLLTTGDLSLSGLTSLTNDNATIQAANLSLGDIGTLTNTNGGTLYSSENMLLSNIDTLNNSNGALIKAAGALTLSVIDKLNNSNAATLVSKNDASLSRMGTLNNTASSVIQAGGTLSVSDVNTLNNTSESAILASGDMTLDGVNTLNNHSAIVGNKTVTLSHGDTLKNEGVIQSGTDLIVRNIRNLINQGSDHVLSAMRSLTINDIETLRNADQAVISAGMNTVLNAIGIVVNTAGGVIQAVDGALSITADTLNNSGSAATSAGRVDYSTLVAAGDVSINAQNVTNAEKANIVSTDSNLTLNVANRLDNLDGSVLFGSNGTTVNLQDGTLRNLDGSLIAGYNVNLNAQHLENTTDASIIADNKLTLDVGSLNNIEGHLEAGHTLALDVDDDLTLDGKNSSIHAGNQLNLTTHGNFTNNTQVEAIGTLNVNADKAFVNNQSIVTGGDLNVSANSITNNRSSLMWALGKMDLQARNNMFYNSIGGNVLSMGDMSIIAKTIWNYAGLIRSEKNINLDAELIKNQSTYTGGGISDTLTQDSVGHWKTIENVTTKVDISTVMHMVGQTSDIALDKLAEISAGGDININQRNIYDQKSLQNLGGLIQAGNDINIKGDVLNTPKYVSESLYDYLTIPLDEPITITYYWRVAIDHYTTWKFDSLYQYLDFMFGFGTAASVTGKEPADKGYFFNSLLNTANESPLLNSTMIKIFGETWNTSTRGDLVKIWSNLSKEDYAPLKSNMIYFVPLEKGEITAGRNFNHSDGLLDNGIARAGIVNTRADVKDIDVGDYSVDSVVAGYDINVNTKTIDELSMGISPLPSIKDMTSLPGMFEVSEDFKKAQDAKKNGTEYALPSNNLIPVFETRPEMIDQSQYTGSDDFFDEVDYTPEAPINVIGDNYFISELIRREISNSVGSFFAIRDGLEGDALVKRLMENAGEAAKDSGLGLTVGEALTAEQRENLDRDIVWFVTQNLNGVDVMVPVVYLSQQTQAQIKSGDVNGGTATLHAGNDMNIDAGFVNNVNGSMSAKGDISVTSVEGLNNVSNGMNAGIKAGGDVSITATYADINNNGAQIAAGKDVNLSAANGDIVMTASVGREESGKQTYHAFNDGVVASQNVTMEAKNITSNASDINAGQDITLKATEGNITFNDLHEIDASHSIDTTLTGAGSYISVDKQTESAEAVGANVRAAGNLTIDASNDVTLEGGTYNANTGEIKAGNNVTLKTSEDVAFTEETTTSRQFVADASASGGGKTVTAEYGKNKNTFTKVDSGEYVSPGSQSATSAIGAKPGKAPTGDTASFRFGMETITDTKTTNEKTNTNAALNFGDSGKIEAGKTVDIGGADLKAGNDLSLTAEDVASTKYVDESKTESSRKETFIGVSGEAHSTLVDSADKVGNLIEKSKEGQSVNGGMTTLEVMGDASNILLNDLAGGSVTIGGKTQKTTETKTATAENITNVNAGNLSINTRKDTTLNGVEINANSVDINAGGDVSMNSAKATTATASSTETHSAGITAGVGMDLTGVSGGVSVDYSGSIDHAKADTVSHTNSAMNASTVKINSGGDLNMTGANITADTAKVDVAGDMNVKSVQDIDYSEADRANWGASVGVGISSAGVTPSFAANGGGGSESHDGAQTAKQSGINTTNSLDVTTGGDLNMTGAHLVSENGTGSVNVGGDINAKTLDDRIEQDGVYGGGGIGIGGTPGKSGGTPSANIYVDTVDEIHFNETQKSTIAVGETTSKSVNGNVNTDKEAQSVVTRDEKEAGNNISFTLADPGLRKKSSDADVDTPSTPDVDTPDDHHSGNGGCKKGCGATQIQTESARTLKVDTVSTDTARSVDVPKVTPSQAQTLKPKAEAASTVKTETVSTETAKSVEVPKVTPSQSQTLTPKSTTSLVTKPDTKPVKKWAVPDTNYPTLSPGSATGKTGMDAPKTPKHKQWNGDMTHGVTPSSSANGTDVKLSPGSSTGQTGMDMPKTPEHKQWNGDMTHGVAPSSSANGTDVKLSPGSSTGQTGMDMPKTPEHKQWNGDMTNGVAPSSSANGTDVKLSPGSSTGQTGMDMPKTPEHKTWNGNMNSAMNQPVQWKPLMQEMPINIYAAVTIEFHESAFS